MAGHRSVGACTCAKGFKLKPSDSEIWGGHPLVKEQDLLGDLHTNRDVSGAKQQTNQRHVYPIDLTKRCEMIAPVSHHLSPWLPCESLRNSMPKLTASFISCDASSGVKIQTTKQGAGCCKTMPHMGATRGKTVSVLRVINRYIQIARSSASVCSTKRKNHLPKPTDWMHSAHYALQKINMEPKHGGSEGNLPLNWVIFRFHMKCSTKELLALLKKVTLWQAPRVVFGFIHSIESIFGRTELCSDKGPQSLSGHT